MKRKNFLVVMACLDETTQREIKELRRKLYERGIEGYETKDVPYHVSLGSFPLNKLGEIEQAMEKEASVTEPFELTLKSYSDFGGRVLYLRPEESAAISDLRKKFDCSYADGLDFVPHVTLLIGEEKDVSKAKEILGEAPVLKATVTYLLLGRFFPAQYLRRCDLKGGLTRR